MTGFADTQLIRKLVWELKRDNLGFDHNPFRVGILFGHKEVLELRD